MRLRIEIDAVSSEIDSTDPELLGKWVTEIFGRAVAHGITPATQIRAIVYPSWVPDDSPQGGRPDWIADSRIIGHIWATPTPRDLVAALSAQLDEAEAISSGIEH